MRFETLAVHTASEKDPSTGAVAPPIHLSTTFEHETTGAVNSVAAAHASRTI